MIKKVISLFLLFFFVATTPSYAFSNLYYLKNTNSQVVGTIVDEVLVKRKFKTIKSNPYYALSKDEEEHALIILQQSGENLFYYYESDENKRVNRNILKEIKKQDIICEQSENASIIQIFDNLAQNVMSNNENKYTFEEPKKQEQSAVKHDMPKKINTLSGYVANIPSGTKLPVYLQTPISTATASYGDKVVAVTTSDINLDGNVIFPQGSVVYGFLSKARPATYGSRNGRVVIEFNQVVTPDNKVYDISVEQIDFTVSNEGKIARSAKSMVIGAAVGAIIGILISALTCDWNSGSAIAIGAGVGAGSSLIHSTAERGVDAEIPSYMELELVLTRTLKVLISNF